jgi:hypothetical protein
MSPGLCGEMVDGREWNGYTIAFVSGYMLSPALSYSGTSPLRDTRAGAYFERMRKSEVQRQLTL